MAHIFDDDICVPNAGAAPVISPGTALGSALPVRGWVKKVDDDILRSLDLAIEYFEDQKRKDAKREAFPSGPVIR